MRNRMIEASIDWELKVWRAFLDYRHKIMINDMLFWRLFGNHMGQFKTTLKTQIKESIRCSRC